MIDIANRTAADPAPPAIDLVGGEPRQPRARGRLRIYLGAAPGVGKTFAMLREAHRLRAEGHDVVIGYLETHGRAETAAQVGDLETVPRAIQEYKTIKVEEMDLDAVLARHPEIVLVDELAHTNAPGSRHAKRWQDIQELRDAGINVISTLNIQHLESLGDVMRGVIGAPVNETAPDSELDDAEVQLIDLPIDALIDRLQQGRIYPPGLTRMALEHFFRPGTLAALRELALRRTAAGVDDALVALNDGAPLPTMWRGSDRLLVYLEANAGAGDVLRAGWRMASALRVDLVALVIAPPGGVERLPALAKSAAERALRLADDLGATTRVLESAQPLDALASAAHDEHATVLVLGYQPPAKLGWLTRPSFVDQLMSRLHDVDLHLVRVDDPERQ